MFEIVQGRTPFVDFPGDQDMPKILKRICLMKFNPLLDSMREVERSLL